MLQRTALFLLLVFVSRTPPARGDGVDTRPNILFAFADDWGRYASAYALLEPGGIGDLVSTPHFDRVADEGVLLTNAFVNAPSCTPCRSSLLSGQYFWRTGLGAILQGAVWDDRIPAFPLLLEDAGYHIGFTSKVWGPGTPANAPYGGGKNAYNRRGGKMNQFSQYVSGQKDADAAKQTIFDEVRGNFDDFLADRDDGQPFCYWFGPTNCHRKWIAGSGKQLWGIDPDRWPGRCRRSCRTCPLIREDIADYLGEVQAFDAALGVLLDRLEELGELDNTHRRRVGGSWLSRHAPGQMQPVRLRRGGAARDSLGGEGSGRPRGGGFRLPAGPCADVSGGSRSHPAGRDDGPQPAGRADVRRRADRSTRRETMCLWGENVMWRRRGRTVCPIRNGRYGRPTIC